MNLRERNRVDYLEHSQKTTQIHLLFFTPQRIRRRRAAACGHIDHDRLGKYEGTQKDEEDIIEKGNNEQGRRHLQAVEFNDLQKQDTHAHAKDILRDPKEGDPI